MEKLKQIDKKILTGLGITLVCLIVWLVTLPLVSYKSGDFDSYSGLNETQRYEQTIKDIDSYNRAILFKNNEFCANILNTTVRKECSVSVPPPSGEPVVNQELQEPKNTDDIDNYNRAILFKDNTYCDKIIDEEMKNECLASTPTAPPEVPAENEEVQPQKEKSVEDIDNYNKAILFKDNTYCDKIIDEEMKNECLNW